MGSVRETKSGYLFFDFYYNGVRCREYTELNNTPENLKLMNDAIRRIDSEIRLGTFNYAKYFPESKNKSNFSAEDSESGGISFEGYAERWYKNNKISWKPSVRKDFYSTMHCHLVPYFKDKAITGITKAMIKEFRTSLALLPGKKGLMSNKRINNIISVLRLIINEAAEDLEFTSPFVNLKPLSIKKPEIMPFSLEDVFTYIHAVPKDFYNYYAVRFFTGMRTAEIDGLKWKYVDFKNKRIQIRETWQGGQWVSPKTESSVRDIEMSSIVEEALLAQKERTGSRELVFCSKKGKTIDYNNTSKRIWYPTLEKLGFASRNPYQTRHTAATLWLASGENPEWVARQLGHSNTEMLFKVYSKFIPNLTRRDGSAFEGMLNKKIRESESQKNEEGKCI